MTIPVATTTIAVARTTDTASLADPYDLDPSTTSTAIVASGVRAVISPPTATVGLVGGAREEYDAKLTCDPCDIQAGDTVTDSAGNAWTVLWALPFDAFGLDHVQGGLRMVSGAT